MQEAGHMNTSDGLGGDGPGIHGGPADERLASGYESAKLKRHGWRETNVGVLWIAPERNGGGFHSVDEALAMVNAGECGPLSQFRD